MSKIDRPATASPHVEEALKPILYADIFDYPLTFDEIYRFLEFKTTRETLRILLDQALADQSIMECDGFYSLADRPHLAAERQERWAAAQDLWPKATHYGHWMATLPFVRMVAVTGSLAVENPRNGVDDIDYLIVTQPGRLWFCRAIIILLVRYAHLRGVHLCPNFLLTENVLYFADNNLFIAREMVQMVPLYGRAAYLSMRQMNAWVVDYLPHGTDLNLQRLDDDLALSQRWLKKVGERLLGGTLGDWVETPLQTFQINKHLRLAKKYGADDKVIFTADQCRGHIDGHHNRVMDAYQGRVKKYNQTAEGIYQ
ncbi:MAG: hypothetical protein KDF65_10340 [Anaerolineae bacterium]|nr:hypothetical protein [Anaerolineae bacterium]